MKEKIAGLLVVLALSLMLSSCDMGKEGTASGNESLNDMSSVISGNIPSDNSDGEYDNDNNDNDDKDDDDDNDKDDNNTSSKTLGDEVSDLISSGKDAINSMVD